MVVSRYTDARSLDKYYTDRYIEILLASCDITYM